MHLRIKYGKTAKGRFLSHLDLMRAWERALRRAEIPIAFSQGFNPHPKMSFGSALAVGVTSSGEYMDIELKNSYPIKEIASKLEKYLPAGLEIYEIAEIDNKTPSLMSVINRAKYLVKANINKPFSQDNLDKYLASFLEKKNIMILRETKKGLKEKDIRAGIFDLKGKFITNDKLEFELLVQTGSAGNVRPEEVIKALHDHGLSIDIEILDIHREGLYIESEKGLNTPLVTQ